MTGLSFVHAHFSGAGDVTPVTPSDILFPMRIPESLLALLTDESAPASHAERVLSGIGALLGIGMVFVVSNVLLPPGTSAFIIASTGASVVLLFALPHSPLSQPWPLLGGHVVSAIIGVTCAQWITHTGFAAALAVGTAITTMYYLRCLHPPGGATALAAVISGDAVHALGYQFILMPVLLNAVIVLLVAIAFNACFSWRRYPAALARRAAPSDETPGVEPGNIGVAHEDLTFALAQMKSYVDVREQDLADIYRLALNHALTDRMRPEQIRAGRHYSNGRYGDEWSVRSVVDESGIDTPEKDKVIFRVIAGKDRRTVGTCKRTEFARWAKYEVERHENTWQRVHSDD